MPTRIKVDRAPVLADLAETNSCLKTARRLGLHENTVRQIDRFSRGVCTRCGQHPHQSGQTKCRPCADQERQRTANKRADARSKGQCTMCPKPLKKGSTLYCEAHYRSTLARQARFRLRDRFGPHGEPTLKAANGICQICRHANGRKRALDLHHIDENQTNGSAANLIAICHNCHRAVHYLLLSKDLPRLLSWFRATYTPPGGPTPKP